MFAQIMCIKVRSLPLLIVSNGEMIKEIVGPIVFEHVSLNKKCKNYFSTLYTYRCVFVHNCPAAVAVYALNKQTVSDILTEHKRLCVCHIPFESVPIG